MMQYQNHLFLDTKSSAENKYIKFVKRDAFPLPNVKYGASAGKRTKVNPEKKKKFQCYRPAKTNGPAKTSRLDITPNYLAKAK